MFTIRIEIHSGSASNYQEVHEAAERLGFKRTIRSDDGIEYYLPPAEYNFMGTKSREQVRELACQAARVTGRAFSVLVTESVARCWTGLVPVTSHPYRSL